MSDEFVVEAKSRETQGTGASRRLRREGWTPAIVYGAGKEPQSIVVSHRALYRQMGFEAFFSHILKLEIDGKAESVVIKDVQRHPARKQILHADFLRVRADTAIRVRVPLHFEGEDIAPGVKTGGGVVDHMINDVEVECLPKHLPEYIEVDVSKMELDETLHLSELKLPEGVELVELKHENDAGVLAIHLPRKVQDDEEEGGEEEEGSSDEETKGASGDEEASED